jgi:hypothetical protein
MSHSICDICFENIEPNDINHLAECFERQLKYMQQYEQKLECKMCHKEIPLDQINEHEAMCYKKNDIGLKNLTAKQIKALDYCIKKSKVFSKNVYGNLLVRFLNKGLTEENLQQTLEYIKNYAQVTINFRMDILGKALSEDSKYKSRYEVYGLTTNAGRDQWENTLFNRIYDETTQPFERVKYGALNITNDPLGISTCRVYGDSFMVLKNHIKQRATFTHGDSSQMEIHLCMADNFCNILLYIDDALLESVVQIATGKINYATSSPNLYIECQIHGDLIFARDVEVLVINGAQRYDPIMLHYLEQFEKKNGVRYVWMK